MFQANGLHGLSVVLRFQKLLMSLNLPFKGLLDPIAGGLKLKAGIIINSRSLQTDAFA
jgi:hypothetical protein